MAMNLICVYHTLIFIFENPALNQLAAVSIVEYMSGRAQRSLERDMMPFDAAGEKPLKLASPETAQKNTNI
jgi:hypothetical protein